MQTLPNLSRVIKIFQEQFGVKLEPFGDEENSLKYVVMKSNNKLFREGEIVEFKTLDGRVIFISDKLDGTFFESWLWVERRV